MYFSLGAQRYQFFRNNLQMLQMWFVKNQEATNHKSGNAETDFAGYKTKVYMRFVCLF
jgi:hypothetical protein